jgi:hypothetical protein
MIREKNVAEKQQIPKSVEQGFRWMRETISLVYAHHRHPLPMVALIFMYAETLGKPLVIKDEGERRFTEEKVCAFVESYLPKLWAAFEWSGNRRNTILYDHYRNGLIHQMFMKEPAGIHEVHQGDTQYVWHNPEGTRFSINIDRLVPEFLDGINTYYQRLETDKEFLETFRRELLKKF